MEEMSPFLAAPQEGGKSMPASKAQQRAVSNYKQEHAQPTKERAEKGQKDIIKAHAEARGESVNGFIGRAIDETMERDNAARGEATEGE